MLLYGLVSLSKRNRKGKDYHQRVMDQLLQKSFTSEASETVGPADADQCFIQAMRSWLSWQEEYAAATSLPLQFSFPLPHTSQYDSSRVARISYFTLELLLAQILVNVETSYDLPIIIASLELDIPSERVHELCAKGQCAGESALNFVEIYIKVLQELESYACTNNDDFLRQRVLDQKENIQRVRMQEEGNQM